MAAPGRGKRWQELSRVFNHQGSITAAQASVGNAAAWPTTGTILMTADEIRQGAASTPQPLVARASSATTQVVAIRCPLEALEHTGLS